MVRQSHEMSKPYDTLLLDVVVNCSYSYHFRNPNIEHLASSGIVDIFPWTAHFF